MAYYIDQSGKLEYTSQDTVLAYANDHQRAVLIKSEDKQQIQNLFRQVNKPDIFVYKTFAALCLYLLRPNLKKHHQIVIDTEYWGREVLIKNFLINMMRDHGFPLPKDSISFTSIGKKNQAHQVAIQTFRGQGQPDKIVTYGELLKLIL